jgi:hypothetical protein
VAEGDCIKFYNYVTGEEFEIVGGVLYLTMIDNASKILYIDHDGKLLCKELPDIKKDLLTFEENESPSPA